MTMDNRSRDPRGRGGGNTMIMILVAIVVVVAAIYMFGMWGDDNDLASDVDAPAVTDTPAVTQTPPTVAPDTGTGSTATESVPVDPAINTEPAPTTTAPAAQ